MPSETSEGLGALASPRRISKFLSVGVAGAVVDLATLTLLVEVGHLHPSVGKVFSAETAIVAMFVLNERWTFASHGGTDPWDVGRRFLRSNVVRAGGALWALGVLHLLTTYAGVWYLAANVVGIGTGFAINYVFESVATWRVHR
jgi:putative flippase GtrA